jgi:hypothetical protein
VAYLSFAQDAHAQQNSIAVAVGPCGNYLESIAGGLAFRPQFLPSAAIEGDKSRPQSSLQRFAIHETHHQQLLRSGVLDHRGRQTLHFVEVDPHKNLLFLPPTFSNKQQKQKTRCAFGVSGLGFPISALGFYPYASADTLIA